MQSWKKSFVFRLKLSWSLFLKVILITSQHWFREWLGAGQVTSHYEPIMTVVNEWRIYVSLDFNELMLPNIVCIYLCNWCSAMSFACEWTLNGRKGLGSNIKTIFPNMGITIIKIRWFKDCLIFKTEIPVLEIHSIFMLKRLHGTLVRSLQC